VVWLSPKKQKNWNRYAIHLLLMLIHCRKAAKLFLDFKRNLLMFSTTVYWGKPWPIFDKNQAWIEYCSCAHSKSSSAICYYLLVWVWVFCACTDQTKYEELFWGWAWRRHEIGSEQDCSKLWQSCGNDTQSEPTLIKSELLLCLYLGLG